jgi:CBS domain-containing protein
MTMPVIKCHPLTTVEEALNIMAGHRVRRLAVTENGEIIGEVSLNIMISTYFKVKS